MDARNSAQNPGAMAAYPKDSPQSQPVLHSYASAAKAGSSSSQPELASTSSCPPGQNFPVSSQDQDQLPELSKSGSQNLTNPTNQMVLDTSTGELIPVPISGPSQEENGASHGVANSSSGPGSQTTKGSYLDRSGNRHTPYKRPANNAKGDGDKISRELADAEALLNSLSPSPSSPPQHSSSPIHPGGESPGGASGHANEEGEDGNRSGTIVVNPADISNGSVPDDIEEMVSENKLDSIKMLAYQKGLQAGDSDDSSDSVDPDKATQLPPDAPLVCAGILTQTLNNTVSDLYSPQGSDKVDAGEDSEDGESATVSVKADDEEEELDYEPVEPEDSKTPPDSEIKSENEASSQGADNEIKAKTKTTGEPEDKKEEDEEEDGANNKPALESNSKTKPASKTATPTPSSSASPTEPQQPASSTAGYKIPRITAPPPSPPPSVAQGSASLGKGTGARPKVPAAGAAPGSSKPAKKTPSQKKIHRKQNPEQVPDFLVIDPAIIPPERDPRYLDRGYTYVDKDQWKADYIFLKLKLKEARASVATNIFDTDTVARPSNFLRRFWASTGVSKSKPLTDVVADILNSKNGWTEIYNNFAQMEVGGRDWSQTLTLLQDMAIQICRTAAFKKTQQLKSEEEEKKKAEILKKAKQQGHASASGAFKNSGKLDSVKSGRFDKPAKKMAANDRGGADGNAPGDLPPPDLPPPNPAPAASSSTSAGQDATSSSKSSLKPPPGRYGGQGNGKSVSFDKPHPEDVAAHVQNRVNAKRTADAKAAEDTGSNGDGASAPKPSAKARLWGNKKEQDYFLVDLRRKQKATLEDVFPKPPPTPSSAAEDSGLGNSHGDGGASPTDEVTFSVSQTDMTFGSDDENSAGHSAGKVKQNSNSNSNSSSSQDGNTPKAGSQRRRIIVTSIPDDKGKSNVSDLTENDLIQFKIRLDKHVEEFNDAIDEEDDPINLMIPWVEKGKIIVFPEDATAGGHLIEIINRKIRLAGRKIQAGWNVDLPPVATISIRYESVTGREPRTLMEDPKKGLARLNRWKLEGREIAFRSATQDPKNPHISFAQVVVSKRICQLIQQQQGRLWIHGGQATAEWRDKPLVEGLEVQFHYQ